MHGNLTAQAVLAVIVDLYHRRCWASTTARTRRCNVNRVAARRTPSPAAELALTGTCGRDATRRASHLAQIRREQVDR